MPGPGAPTDADADADADEQETPLPSMEALVDEPAAGPPGTVLVMGKGGVGRTTVAAAIARRGHDVVIAALTASGTQDPLRPRAALERPRLHRVRDELAASAWLVPWQVDALVGEDRLAALTHATSR